MAIKAVSDMTQEELETLRGKRSVKPLFELTNNRRGNTKSAEEIEEVKEVKVKRERRFKKEKKQPIEKQKPEKKRKKEQLMDIVSKTMSKKELREARKKKKEEESKVYPNETKKERKSRLRREKIEAAAEEKLKELETHERVKPNKGSNHSTKILYDDNAHNKLIEIYQTITVKKTKKEQEYDEVFRKHLKKIGIIIALHEKNSGSERFSMMGKLVEKGYAAYRAYAYEYHLYEILG